MFQVLFQDGPPQPVPIPQELKDQARRTMGLNCEQFYNVAVVGVAGTGKVNKHAAVSSRHSLFLLIEHNRQWDHGIPRYTHTCSQDR